MGMDSFDAAAPQPAPKGDGESVTDAMIQDLTDRREAGKVKYGTELKSHNGRDPLVDAYQEALDLSAYLRQEIMERKDAAEAVEALESARGQLYMLRNQIETRWVFEDIVKKMDKTLAILKKEALPG